MIVVNELYTIGYAGFCIQDFIDLLKYKKIQVVIDIRSIPYSKHFSEYNKENLQAFLKGYDIYYRNYAKEFGAQQENKDYYSEEGFLDFKEFSLSESFKSGINKLKTIMEKDYVFVLMCSEKDPFECHRSIMVSRSFEKSVYRVNHLLLNGDVITQEKIEDRLLDKYFPNKQLSLFGTDTLAQAYRKRNFEIGHRSQDLEQ